MFTFMYETENYQHQNTNFAQSSRNNLFFPPRRKTDNQIRQLTILVVYIYWSNVKGKMKFANSVQDCITVIDALILNNYRLRK